jgi:hypothetical protein
MGKNFGLLLAVSIKLMDLLGEKRFFSCTAHNWKAPFRRSSVTRH